MTEMLLCPQTNLQPVLIIKTSISGWHVNWSGHARLQLALADHQYFNYKLHSVFALPDHFFLYGNRKMGSVEQSPVFGVVDWPLMSYLCIRDQICETVLMGTQTEEHFSPVFA